VLLALAVTAACAFTVRYDGHQVLRVVPQDRVQLDTLRKLIDMPHGPMDWDFWKSPGAINKIVDIRVSPAFLPVIKDFINNAGLNYTTEIPNLQVYFEQARTPVGDTWDTEYHDLADINNWITGLANANPSFVKLINIGKSYEGKDILGLKITKATSTTVPQLYIDGGIHAREWMAPATVQYIIGQFVNHASDYDSYLKNFEWYFIPVFNPDGYDYTWTTDPNWRKNRQPNKGACVGTDPCRNAEAGWGGAGSSSDPCSDIYHGTAAWSAPMMASFRDFISNMTKLQGYINFHSNAEMWLNAYGYTSKKPADYAAQEQNAKNTTAAIKSVSGSDYGYGPAYTTIYPAAGVPSDWVYDKFHVKFSQAVELRGDSFQPSPTMIIPIGKEIMQGVLKLADDILANIPA